MRPDDRRLAAADPALPGLAVVLEPAALLDRVRATDWGAHVHDAEVTYLRYKPGTSITAGLVLSRADGRSSRAYATAHRPDAPEKLRKAERAARKARATVVTDEAGAVAVGEARADRTLPGIRHVLRARPHVESLVYKPGRRWVAVDRADDGTAEVLKVHRPGRADVHVAAHRLLAGQVPTAPLLRVDPGHGVVRTAYLAGTPLDEIRPPDAAAHWHEAGVLLAALHAAPVPPGPVPRDRRRLLSAAVDGISAVAPDLAGPARAAAQQVLLVLDGAGRLALVHGDLSADQVLLRPDGSLALIDLDRAGVDHPLADLASWAAAELAAGRSVIADPARLLGPLLAGYRSAGGDADPRVLRALTAGAVLQRAIEPFRTHTPGWAGRVAALVTAAAELAADAAPGARAGGRAAGRARLPLEIPDGATRWTVRRAWPRGEDHALLELGDDDGGTVVGQWFADPADLARAAGREPAPARISGPLLLQPDGADRRLPGLLGVLARPGARLVAHRPGRRAVVRVATPDGTAFVKVVRPTRVADLAARAARVNVLRSAVVPALLGVDPAAGTLRFSGVGERTLLDLGADPATPDPVLSRAWEQAGRATAELHLLDRDGLAHHGPEEELAAVAAWTGPAVRHGLLDAAAVHAATCAVADGLRAAPREPLLGVLHRDLHDKQLLVRPDVAAAAAGGLGLIDVDTLAVGERALDVANLEVHLELRVRQGLLTPERAELARLALRAAQPDDERLWRRVPAYAAATRLRLAAVYAFRPRWTAVARGLLDEAAGVPVLI